MSPVGTSSALPWFPCWVPLVPPQYPVPSTLSASTFVSSQEDHFDPGFPDAVPRDPDVLIPPVVPDSVRAEMHRMYAYLDLFPQAAGSPSIDPPPCTFEDFFTPLSTPQQPIYLDWFTRVHTALVEADSCLATFLASGRPDFAFLPSCSTQYVVRGEFTQGLAATVNPSLLALFERPLQPNLQLGLTIREAATLEALFRANSESLSHSIWLLSGLLAFVHLQDFQPADSGLFITLVTSLSKILAHQASVSASQTAFIGLKRRHFYLSHLSAHFSEVNKWAMLSSPFVCFDLLFVESDVARLVADTQASSSLRSQQVTVDVASRSSGARHRHFSPSRSLAKTSPSWCRCRESGSPSRQSKRVRFDSPAPSSAFKGSRSGFRR